MQEETLPFDEAPDAPTERDLHSAESLYALTLLPKVGSGRAIRLASRFGSWDALLRASTTQLRAAAGAPVEVSREPVEAASLTAAGARMVGWFDREYPEELRDLKDPPAVLWVRGTLGATPRLTVVGTRKPTSWALRVADLVAAAAARRGVPVVSGLALGVDFAAHSAAIREGGPTVAVLGGGVDAPSPRRHAELAEQILATGGALVAEVPPGSVATARTLVARNRIQAALSRGTVMVQCGMDSGTMHTARFTVALERSLIVAAPPHQEAALAENAGNLAMLEGSDSPEAPRASFSLRSVDDLDGLFGLLVP